MISKIKNSKNQWIKADYIGSFRKNNRSNPEIAMVETVINSKEIKAIKKLNKKSSDYYKSGYRSMVSLDGTFDYGELQHTHAVYFCKLPYYKVLKLMNIEIVE